ncbi:MAG: WecB/TagA/CpsF family glycosyltransferase [Planctomycetaceae bacterium]|nr:WecB/TagA/CpsF family glycosyltransferase [Planctomycetaceae bacterium]
MIDRGRHNLLGVQIHAVDYEAAVNQIMGAAQHRRPFGVSALAVQGVMTGVLDSEHRHRLNQLELVVPDGQPVRWGLNLLHQIRLRDRVYGPDLMLEVCQAAAEAGVPIFFYGSTSEILERLTGNLLQKFPSLKIAGQRASKFRQLTTQEKQEVIAEIRDSGAAITFVGLGCPRQEVFAYEFREQLQMPTLAVGAAFAFHAGKQAQAPPFMQKAGLGWLFRLAREPRRLWRRYLFLNPRYLSLLFLQKTGLKKYDAEDTQPPNSEMLYG